MSHVSGITHHALVTPEFHEDGTLM